MALQPQPMPTRTVTLPIPGWNYILELLRKRPFEEVVNLLADLETQLIAADQAAAAAATPKPAPASGEAEVIA